jgi:hypothetical protein
MPAPNRYAPRPRHTQGPAHPGPASRPGSPSRRPAPPATSTNRKPWLLATATLAALTLSVGAIDHITKPDPDAPQAGCVIAVDAQGSASTMIENYRKWLPDQARDCAADDRAALHIALVSGETRTGAVTPASSDLRALDYTGNDSNDDTIASGEVDRVVTEADQAILTAPKQRGGTDILGLICVAHDLLDGHSPSTLIVNSDGINNRKPYRLTKIPLDEASITQYVDQLKATGQLCDLTGTQVHMYGVGIGSGTSNLADEQLTGIQRFWEAAFTATGAELVTYKRNP